MEQELKDIEYMIAKLQQRRNALLNLLSYEVKKQEPSVDATNDSDTPK